MPKLSEFDDRHHQFTIPEIVAVDAAADARNDGDDFDDPPPAASAALTIACPRGPQRVRRGYTVYAVNLDIDEDGEEVVLAGQPLSGKITDLASARLVATSHALNAGAIRIPVTHVVANDEIGRERYRLPVFQPRAA